MNRTPIPKENCRKRKESAREDKIQKTECHSLINTREERVEEARKLNLLSDTFMSVALDDVPACQHVLRTLTGVKDLKVKEIRTQYRISKLISHDAILDVVAEDEKGKLYNLDYSDFRFIPINLFKDRFHKTYQQVYRNNCFNNLVQVG